MANSASEIYIRLRHHYSDAPPSSEREKNTEKKGCQLMRKNWNISSWSKTQYYHSIYVDVQVDWSDDGWDSKRIDVRGPRWIEGVKPLFFSNICHGQNITSQQYPYLPE